MSIENEEKHFQLPPLGMRIIKSAIGVFLCYVIDIFRNGHGIVFYSQLAVLWCMQEYKEDTISKAKQRILGTLIGAVYGLIILLVAPFLHMKNSVIEDVIWAAFISLFIVVILYSTVVVNKKQASYFSCVVFLSIVVNHLTDANPFLFVWNRVLDTLIVIGLGVLVNACSLPREHRNHILFVSGLDDTLLTEEDHLSAYSKVELNRMISTGAKFTVSTMRTPASLMEPLKDIHLNLPVIVMDGAALYDIKQKKYLYEYVISNDCATKVISFFESQKCSYFANVIIDDLLVIYYQEIEGEVYNELIQKLRTSPYRNYVKRPLPPGEQVVYFMLVDKRERQEELYHELLKQPFCERLKVLLYDSTDYPGYAYIKVYNHNATRKNMLQYLRRYVDADEVVTFGTIEGRYTHLIKPGDANQVVRLMKKEYEPVKHWFSQESCK